MRRLTGAILGMLALGAAGCADQLVVENVNSPDAERALARPADVENLLAGQFRQLHNALWNNGPSSGGAVMPQLLVMGLESYSANANWGMTVRSGVPRSLIDNSRGNTADTYTTYQSLMQIARSAAVCLQRFNDPGFTFFPTSAAQLQRDRAFGYFVKGVALGYAAMIFDSGPVVQPGDDLETLNPFVGYDSLMRVAIADLDSAIAIASLPTPSGSNGFPLPATWINNNATLTGGSTGGFARLVRTLRARLRASVARTPDERAAVDWAAVIADAQNGITADFYLTMVSSGTTWLYQPVQAATYQSWHQNYQHFVGMADTSGGYDVWLNTPRLSKAPFLVVTNDSRFPAGTTRAAQNASSGCVSGATCTPPAGQYHRNRLAGQDTPVDGLYHSWYDFHRFQSYYNAAQNGPLPFYPRAELDLLAAEGYIRLGDFPNAMASINLSRTAHGLPALSGITSINDLIPGPGCVPRVPVGPTNATNATPTATACGNIMEAMKWEKRQETHWLAMGQSFFDARGWGDLPYNTPINFPVPYTELDARQIPIYSAPVNGLAATTYTAAQRLSNSASNYGIGVP
jgi:hypothetical protein